MEVGQKRMLSNNAFSCPFWLSHILVYYFTSVLAYVQARTEVKKIINTVKA